MHSNSCLDAAPANPFTRPMHTTPDPVADAGGQSEAYASSTDEFIVQGWETEDDSESSRSCEEDWRDRDSVDASEPDALLKALARMKSSNPRYRHRIVRRKVEQVVVEGLRVDPVVHWCKFDWQPKCDAKSTSWADKAHDAVSPYGPRVTCAMCRELYASAIRTPRMP